MVDAKELLGQTVSASEAIEKGFDLAKVTNNR
jgi:hypothetical protein